MDLGGGEGVDAGGVERLNCSVGKRTDVRGCQSADLRRGKRLCVRAVAEKSIGLTRCEGGDLRRREILHLAESEGGERAERKAFEGGGGNAGDLRRDQGLEIGVGQIADLRPRERSDLRSRDGVDIGRAEVLKRCVGQRRKLLSGEVRNNRRHRMRPKVRSPKARDDIAKNYARNSARVATAPCLRRAKKSDRETWPECANASEQLHAYGPRRISTRPLLTPTRRPTLANLSARARFANRSDLSRQVFRALQT